MRIHHLNCGTMCPWPGRLFSDHGSLVHRGRIVCHCLAIESDAGLELVDTGIGTADDVRHIVPTHLDPDHAGGLSDFPGAAVHVLAAEHAAAMAPATANERRRY